MGPSSDLSEEERRLFSARIELGLAERPLGLDPAAHRQSIAALIERVGVASFYELLGVAPGASMAEVHDAYERLGRLVHPRHAATLGLDGRQGVLEHLFERATAAYLTLVQPERRKAYDHQLGDRLWSAETWGTVRGDEERQVARRYFVKAGVLAAQEEYHLAIELLRQAVHADPLPEYYTLLGQLEAKNPHWLRLAEASLERAVELGGRDPALTATLTHVREQMAGTAAAEGGASAAAATPKASRGKRLFGPRR